MCILWISWNKDTCDKVGSNQATPRLNKFTLNPQRACLMVNFVCQGG